MLRSIASLEQQKAKQLYRQRPCVQPLSHNLITTTDQKFQPSSVYTNFSSNDYCGLAHDERIIQALCFAAKTVGVGATASRMICGHHPLHQALEEAFANWMGYETALLFSNGYMANLGILEVLAKTGCSFYLDKLCHNSLMMGARFAQAPFIRYQHNDPQSLARQLITFDSTEPCVITEGIFSMEGDIAPLPELLATTAKKKSLWLVDDAHGIGVLGREGKGISEHFGFTADEIPILILPLGKAFGTYGALVLTNSHYRELMIQFSSTYTYTTNIPPALCAASLKSLEIIQTEPERRTQLHRNIHTFKTEAKRLGLCSPERPGPIQLLYAKNNTVALNLQEHLKTRGFYVQAIRSPSVPIHQPRLRITLNCHHSTDDIQKLLQCIAEGPYENS